MGSSPGGRTLRGLSRRSRSAGGPAAGDVRAEVDDRGGTGGFGVTPGVSSGNGGKLQALAPAPSAAFAPPAGFSALDPCVHCGFCLPACPTYLATGDEADSPRGRILLMRALERDEMTSADAALVQHLDACLGCRGCEPVCPSGVQYGRGLEQARERLYAERGLPPLARTVLGVFRNQRLWRPLFTLARLFRGTGLPRALAGGGRFGFGMGMVASTAVRRYGGTAVGDGGGPGTRLEAGE